VTKAPVFRDATKQAAEQRGSDSSFIGSKRRRANPRDQEFAALAGDLGTCPHFRKNRDFRSARLFAAVLEIDHHRRPFKEDFVALLLGRHRFDGSTDAHS
jgi:hypothetical protein